MCFMAQNVSRVADKAKGTSSALSHNTTPTLSAMNNTKDSYLRLTLSIGPRLFTCRTTVLAYIYSTNSSSVFNHPCYKITYSLIISYKTYNLMDLNVQ